MKKILLSLALATVSTTMFSQGAKNIKINEVMTGNATSIQDEYGRHLPWVELTNTSFSTYNIRGMYISTTRATLDKQLSAPERIKMMSPIPNGDKRTELAGHEHLVLYLNSNPAEGTLHLRSKVTDGAPVWVALYDANGIDIIDSVSLPAMKPNLSFAREKDGSQKWVTKSEEAVTPGITNYIQVNESKIARLKRDDPHGIMITVLSMGIVFFCLALLYAFFSILGVIIVHQRTLKRAKNIQPIKAAVVTSEIIHEGAHKTKVMLKDGLHTQGIDREVYMAVIAMALKDYQNNEHDTESGIITIKPRTTAWNR